MKHTLQLNNALEDTNSVRKLHLCQPQADTH